MEIIESILTNNPCYKAGKKIKVSGLMLHSVGCPQPSAETFVKKWNTPESSRACVHAFIDGKTGKVYQTLPWDHRAWHCGGNANSTHVGVEMCEPSCLKYTGGASFSCSDTEAAKACAKLTYEAAAELFAFLCKQYGLDPLADGVIISHKEGHQRGVASGHGDPEHLWTQLQTGYTMNGFRQAVRALLDGKGVTAIPAPGSGGNAGVPSKDKEASAAASTASAAGNAEIQVGGKVRLSPDANYYSGKPIPAWVKNDTWIVKSVEGDKVVIDQNVGGTNSICSPVNVKHLIRA
ncbi:MAG: peptidoglycan recognition protein family protein [Clostridium sp.]|jgi:hypothetical protein|nr:peptidoglycan recognition protein family protein [Clostridium sp.]